jgi:hypothetical protein
LPAPVQLIKKEETKMCTNRLIIRIENPIMMFDRLKELADIFTKLNREIPIMRMAKDSQFSETVL